jgi:hypothetical protein
MTEGQVRAVGPAFARFLGGFERFFDPRSVEHLRNHCRGLSSDRPRTPVEPIALASGTAVRTLQEVLKDHVWDRDGGRDALRRRVAAHLGTVRDPLGPVGIADETSRRKTGAKTPGVRRPSLGGAGKAENGVGTVHAGVARGEYQALRAADLFLPESWDADRERCREADTPDRVVYRPKWQIALDQVRRAADGRPPVPPGASGGGVPARGSRAAPSPTPREIRPGAAAPPETRPRPRAGRRTPGVSPRPPLVGRERAGAVRVPRVEQHAGALLGPPAEAVVGYVQGGTRGQSATDG